MVVNVTEIKAPSIQMCHWDGALCKVMDENDVTMLDAENYNTLLCSMGKTGRRPKHSNDLDSV